ncbi:hypothetical protein J6590_084483 [Homalodisca vitripennis]|nr:hypothetical protein J6590_084483 [Homalodisca vitripennis]
MSDLRCAKRILRGSFPVGISLVKEFIYCISNSRSRLEPGKVLSIDTRVRQSERPILQSRVPFRKSLSNASATQYLA